MPDRIIYEFRKYSGGFYIYRVAKDCPKMLKLERIWPQKRSWDDTVLHKKKLNDTRLYNELWTDDEEIVVNTLRDYLDEKRTHLRQVEDKVETIFQELKARKSAA